MLPAPTVAALARYTGRAVDTYTSFATEALAQATLLFTLRTRLTAMPTDPDLLQLAVNAILQMADRIYLEQPYAATLSSPYQSETIGSYTYSKGSLVTKAKDGDTTGLYWWDLAMDLLAVTTGEDSNVQYGGVHAFEPTLTEIDGQLWVLTPADVERDDNSERRIS